MEKDTITIKLDLDMDEAIKKLENYKKQLQEVLKLQNQLKTSEEKLNLSLKFGKVEEHCVDIFTKLEDLAKPISNFIIEKYGKHATAIITDETVKIVIDDISTPIKND